MIFILGQVQMKRKTCVPCYVKNGGLHNIVNVPLGLFTRAKLLNLCRELLKHQKSLETFFAAKATPETVFLLQGLVRLLSLDLKPKKNRAEGQILTTALDKNLSPGRSSEADFEELNLVDFAVKCGVIALLFALGMFLEYLETSSI